MKDLDFLPDWYKDRKRRHSLVRKQYIALAAVFLIMMTFNLTATHRAARVAAAVAHGEDQAMHAESVVHEFNAITKELNRMKTRADLAHQIDGQVDVAAILAEISHIVDDSIVLSKIDLTSEPLRRPDDKGPTKGSPLRVADRNGDAQREVPLGGMKLRVVLAGVAVQSAHVADLVCKLEESAYFQQVRPSFYGKTKIPTGASRTAERPGNPTGTSAPEMLDVTAFEIGCYLANYEETGR